MRWSDGFIAVDWGTTNRRAYRLDENGQCLDSFEDGQGILSVQAGEFPAAAAHVRACLGDLPMLLAGMVGSTRGWMETPYVACPANLEDVLASLTWVEQDGIAIVPGLSVIDQGRPDVMRGEEVQLFGAIAAGLVPPTCFVGHPGTHNKWIAVDDGQITNFRTVMTGELFGMLRERGMLAEMLTGEVLLGDSFRHGVRRGLSGSVLTAELFSVRAAALLRTMPPESASSFVSGLLIGADVRAGLDLADGSPILFMGDPDLTCLYAAAAEVAERDSRQVDGKGAFLAGAMAIGRLLR